MGLTAKQFPYTGPYGLPASGLKSKGPTAEALKRAMWRMGLLKAGPPFSQHYDQRLALALGKWDSGKSGYGKGRWTKIRKARVPKGLPNAGELALDAVAVELVQNEAKPTAVTMYYPIPVGSGGGCQGLHETAGIAGNWAIDVCAPDNTTVVAAEAGTIAYLSGHPPWEDTWDTQGVFGWSVHFTAAGGYKYFVTHMGYRMPSLKPGFRVEAGDPLGRVGDQRFRPDHVHYGVSSPHGEADARKRITEVSLSPRVFLK